MNAKQKTENRKQKTENNKVFKILIIVLSILVPVFFVNFLIYTLAWNPPTESAPGSNAPTFLSVSNQTQFKEGALGIGGVFQTETETHLALSGGNVGIGTNSPTVKLHVNGHVIADDPTEANHLTTKGYVDSVAASGSKKVLTIFVTENTYDGNLGGHDGANNKCMVEANAKGLQGNWRALLATSSLSFENSLGYDWDEIRLPNGKIIAMSLMYTENARWSVAGPWGVNLSAPFTNNVLDSRVWTGSNRYNALANNTCLNWTSNNASLWGWIGAPGRDRCNGAFGGNAQWFALTQTVCNQFQPLYCIGN